MVLRKSQLNLALCLAVVSASAVAGEVKFNGFASIVSGMQIDGDKNVLTGSGEAYPDDTFDNLQESRLGLQVTAPLSEDIRFIGQAIARGSAQTGFVTNYEWAYMDFDLGESSKFKVGRIRIPFYKYSDYLDVGYAYHWITPPKSMYSLSFSNVDGVGYSTNFPLASGVDASINTVFGRYQGTLSIAGQNSPGDLRNLGAVNFTLTMGDHELYAAYAQADVHIQAGSVNALIAGVEGATGTSINDNKLLFNGDYGSFIGLGYKGSIGDLGLYAEASQVKVEDSALQDAIGGYVGASYSLGSYLVHLTYETQTSEGKSGKGLVTGVAPAAVAAAEAALTRNLRALGGRGSEGSADTITLGVRKELGKGSALKLEVSQYDENRYQSSAATRKSTESATLLKVAFEAMF